MATISAQMVGDLKKKTGAGLFLKVADHLCGNSSHFEFTPDI